MPIATRQLCCSALVCFFAAIALAQAASPTTQIAANQNRVPAGNLENGVLTLKLELRNGAWHPEAENGPTLYVQAFGEPDRPAQIPGPLMRVPAGTTVQVTVTNKLKVKATLHGFDTRPGDAKAGIELEPAATHDFNFLAGAPGTYYYWARTSTRYPGAQPLLEDAHLNGAFIVDPVGPVKADRVFVIGAMIGDPNVLLPDGLEVVTINGKSYPYTEPLEYTAGETVRWRVINPSFSEHPMHMHGAFYQLLTLGDFEKDTAYSGADRQWVVTENLLPAHTMMMEWKPEHVGRWLYHCHFHAHIAADERVPMVLPSADAKPPAQTMDHDHHDGMSDMRDMAGLVLTINVKPAPNEVPKNASAIPPHKIDLVIAPNTATGKQPTFACSVRDGKKLVASEDKSVGPPIVVTRGEPTEITVLNHLTEPTTIHWHGLELDSYYDGVIGGGSGNQVTPAIAPGASFTAHFTPNRAGTFIYHTHAQNPSQLTDGVYGALIVLEPGEQFDPAHDKLLVLGTRDSGFFATRITINGDEAPGPLTMQHGVQYRLRVINMASELGADFQIGTQEHPVMWTALAKDGATLPTRLATTGEASLHIASGETYDFLFQPDAPGEIPLQVENRFAKAKVLTKITVQ